MALWDPPPPRFPHDPSKNDSGPGWHLRTDHATGRPRDYEGRWGTGFAAPLVPERSDRPRKTPAAASFLWAFVSAALLIPAIASGASLALVALAASLLAALVVFHRQVQPLRRWRAERHPDEGPSLLVTVDAVVLVGAGGRAEQEIPWHALREARLVWGVRDGVGHREQRLAVLRDHHTESIGPYRHQPYPWLLNWLFWQLDPDVTFRHRGHAAGTNTELVVVVDRFHCDPRLFVLLVEFYRDHPEQRQELTTIQWEDRATALQARLGGEQ